MSSKKTVIEISAPRIYDPYRPADVSEKMLSLDHVCPVCAGMGWRWAEGRRGDTVKKICVPCGGTGTLDAEITIHWRQAVGDVRALGGNHTPITAGHDDDEEEEAEGDD